ncbi:MAG: glycosyltransferase family 4 protein [Gemmatimonadaceae bacterium]
MPSNQAPYKRTVVSVFSLDPVRIGGVEAFARELSAQLGAHGWQSVLCFLRQPAPEVRAFLDLPNVTLETLPHAPHSSKAAPGLHRVLRRHRPDVLLLQFTPFLSVYPWLARLARVKRVFFVDQGSQPEGWTSSRAPLWKRAIARMITSPLTSVVSISDFNLRVQRSRGLVSPGKTLRIYNAADTTRLHNPELGLRFRQRHRIPPDRVVVAQVSWMIPEKGILDLLDAARIAVQDFPKLHFVLAGEGPHREAYAARASELGIADHVTWTGLVTDPFGEGLFDAADIVCQLSRWEEAFGYVIAEAMVLERPVVATRVGAIPELVEHGETGLLIDRGDSAAAAKAILALVRDPETRRRFGKAARVRADREFNVNKNVARLLEVFGVA